MKRFLSAAVAVVCLAMLSGCGGPSGPALTFSGFLSDLTNSVSIARLDVPGTEIITSYDPAGSNDDFNHYLRKGPAGWIVLADLKGPGCLTRFWFTGADDGRHRIRFFFDGEREARLDVTLDDLTGGLDPFQMPLAAYENYCWYSFVPMPYRKRLVIMAQEGATREGGWPRIFYQVNYTPLAPDRNVRSFALPLSAEEQAGVEAVRKAWGFLRTQGLPRTSPNARKAVVVEPGQTQALDPVTGPAVIRELWVGAGLEALPPADRERVLRDVVMRIAWDGAAAPSVEVPLGDFFGSVWRRTRYESMYFGMDGDTFISRFPMPFRSSAVISFENQGRSPVPLDVTVGWEPLEAWDEGWGYFHAAWSRSAPTDAGRPHAILRTKGRGRYAGCNLGVVSLDRTWWILEGDEVMHRDGEILPRWHGTGLEDYFNGGWYYQNVLPRPLHGLAWKNFFRIVQYRLHLVEPVLFDASFDMTFERGPDHASRGWMESTAYYYLDAPAAAPFRAGAAAGREPPRDPLEEATLMVDLLNYERFGDYRGARDWIDVFLGTYREFPFAELLRLRQIAYAEKLDGYAATKPLYEKFIAQTTNAAAEQQARLLVWFNEDPSRGIASLWSTAPGRLFLDGKDVARTDKPERAAFAGVAAGRGTHAIAAQAGWKTYPSWIQVGLRLHGTTIVSRTDWRYKMNPGAGWAEAGFDDGAWGTTGGTGVKGPPEEPYIWVEPNAFVDLQSLPTGIRPRDDEWPSRQSTVVFRHKFELR